MHFYFSGQKNYQPTMRQSKTLWLPWNENWCNSEWSRKSSTWHKCIPTGMCLTSITEVWAGVTLLLGYDHPNKLDCHPLDRSVNWCDPLQWDMTSIHFKWCDPTLLSRITISNLTKVWTGVIPFIQVWPSSILSGVIWLFFYQAWLPSM